MDTRKLTVDDIDRLLELGAEMHAKSAAAKYPFNREKARAVLNVFLTVPGTFAYGVEIDGTLIGGFIGVASTHYFLDLLIAKDVVIFVTENRRGAFAATKLCKMFEEWAAGEGADECCIDLSSGIEHDRNAKLFTHLGYSRVGETLRKEL